MRISQEVLGPQVMTPHSVCRTKLRRNYSSLVTTVCRTKFADFWVVCFVPTVGRILLVKWYLIDPTQGQSITFQRTASSTNKSSTRHWLSVRCQRTASSTNKSSTCHWLSVRCQRTVVQRNVCSINFVIRQLWTVCRFDERSCRHLEKSTNRLFDELTIRQSRSIDEIDF